MDLLVLVLIAALLGFVIYLLTTKIPMPPYWAQIIQVVALIVLVLYVLTRFVRLPSVLP